MTKLLLNVTLITLLFLLPLLLLPQIQIAESVHLERFNSFENNSDIPKPKNMTCYECADELVKDYEVKLGSCAHFRDLWRKFKKARKKFGQSDYRDEIFSLLKQRFGRNCSYGTEDCFYTRPVDVKIVGWEERGCGSGPLDGATIDAEPGEGCAQDQRLFGGEIVDVLNCVCEDDPDKWKGYCNRGPRTRGGARIGILGLASILLLLQPLLFRDQIF